MEERDYSTESEEEWLEDAFITGSSDKDVEELLVIARKNSDVELRRVLKELLYVRWLMTHIIDVIKDDEAGEFLTIQKLAKNYVKGLDRANNKGNNL